MTRKRSRVRDGSDLLTPDEWEIVLNIVGENDGDEPDDLHAALASVFGEEKAEEIHEYVLAAMQDGA